MADAKPKVHLSQSTKELATKFQPTAITHFLRMPDSTVLHATSPEVVFSCKSNMTASKPEILLYQCRDELETKFQRLYPCFRGCPTQLFYRGSCFQLQIQDGGRKTETHTILMVHYQPTVIDSYSSVSRDCRLLVLMSLLLVLEGIRKSSIAAAKPEIHIL